MKRGTRKERVKETTHQGFLSSSVQFQNSPKPPTAKPFLIGKRAVAVMRMTIEVPRKEIKLNPVDYKDKQTATVILHLLLRYM